MGSYEDIIYRGDNFISLDVQMHTDSDNIPSQKILHLFTSILKMYYILNLMLVFLNYTFINLITLREYKYIFMHNFLTKIFYIFYFIVQKKRFLIPFVLVGCKFIYKEDKNNNNMSTVQYVSNSISYTQEGEHGLIA